MSSNKKPNSSESLKLDIPECGSCKRTIVKNIVKCNICTKVYHPGCANKIKKCCDDDFINSIEENSCDASPLLHSSSRNINNESTHQELLLKIIFELEAKNTILMENNSLLKYKISTLESEIMSKNAQIFEFNKIKKINTDVNMKTEEIQTRDNYSSKVKGAATDDHNRSRITPPPTILVPSAGPSVAPTGRTNSQHPPFDVIKGKQSNPPKLKNTPDVRIPVNKTSEEGKWKVVSHKRRSPKRKALVVGTNSVNTNVEGIEKYRALHVSNLKTETSTEDLQNFLKTKFSDIKCEKLVSKYPESYSSFKVLIPSSEFEKALDGSNWPNKASINRFFQRKQPNRPTD